MQNKKGPVVITGGSGYIGTAIIERLQDNYNIIVLDNVRPQKQFDSVEYKNFNITSQSDIEEVLNEIKKERGETLLSVIHLAGYYNFNGEESSLYEEVNVNGTRNLLKKLYDDFDVGQLIFSSSMLVYKPTVPGIKITEESELAPGWSYPLSKVKCEEIISKYSSRIPSVILRIAAVYNDFGYAPSVAQQVIRINEMHLTSFMFPGDRHHRQSTIHVDDLADVFALAVKKRLEIPANTVLSVSEEETPDFEQLQNEISNMIHHCELPLFTVPKLIARTGAKILSYLPGPRKSFIKPWMIEYSDANYDLDNTKIKSLLGWKPKRSLLETLPVIVSNLSNYPGAWYRINKIVRPPLPSMLRTRLMKQVLT